MDHVLQTFMVYCDGIAVGIFRVLPGRVYHLAFRSRDAEEKVTRSLVQENCHVTDRLRSQLQLEGISLVRISSEPEDVNG